MTDTVHPPSPPLPLRPLCGSLYKRKGRRYIPARNPELAYFWFNYRLPGLSGKAARVALGTTDYATAYCRAQAIVVRSAQWAAEAFLRGKLEAQLGAALGASAPNPRAVTVASALERRLPLDELWNFVRERYDAREKSLATYRQQTEKFVKYARAKGLVFVDEVTRGVAEGYAKWLYPRVTTADKHIACLRREWALLFPDAPANPWNLSIRLQKKERHHAMNYRTLTLNEIRRVRQALVRLKADRTPLGCRGRILSAALLDDMGDAIAFCYHYGLRIGSVDAICWADFDRANGTWRHRPPKTSRATLGNDYPILPEVEAILDRRLAKAGAAPKGPVFPAFVEAHRGAEQLFNLAIKAVFKLAEVPDSPLKGRATWHSFRATFITRLTENGCPMAIVKELAQHAKADMTQRYVHTSMAVKLQWLRTLPDLGEPDLAAAYPTEPELPPDA